MAFYLPLCSFHHGPGYKTGFVARQQCPIVVLVGHDGSVGDDKKIIKKAKRYRDAKWRLAKRITAVRPRPSPSSCGLFGSRTRCPRNPQVVVAARRDPLARAK